MPTPYPTRRLLELARPEARTLLLATAALGLATALNLAYPQFIRIIVDAVLAEDGPPGVHHRYTAILIVLFAVGAALTALRAYLFTIAGERVVLRLRCALYDHLLHQETGFFDSHRTGELISRLATDTTTVQSAATSHLSMLLRHVLTAVGALGLLLLTSVPLTFVMLAVLPPAFVLGLVYARVVRRLSREYQDALARATTTAEETIGAIRTVRAFAREAEASRRYAVDLDDAFVLARRTARQTAAFGFAAGFAAYAALGGVLWYGGVLLVEDRITVGELTSFLLYAFAVAMASGALAGLWQQFAKAVGASERVFELLDRPAGALTGDLCPEAIEGAIAFEGVDFCYPSRPEHSVLRDVDFAIAPGEIVALVGPSGAGKSTVAALLCRLYEPDAGVIRLDGAPLTTLDPTWLRDRIGVVAQEPVLFATTVRENIRFGRPDASDAQVTEAARAANALDFVQALPEGFETPVGERGIQLSGGQKQRVAIARALLKAPRILLLDEATSALDAESEHLVREALARLMHGRTTLIIAHRLSTVRAAQRVVVINGGRVVQSGTHEALVTVDGLYRQLVERQFGDDDPVAMP